MKMTLILKKTRDVFNRLLSKAVLAGKPLEEYLQALPLSSEEKEAIIEYQKKLEDIIHYRNLAEAGDAAAQYRLGWMYRNW